MNKKVATVYKVTNMVNGKIYIGKHIAPANDPLHIQYLGSGIGIKRAIKKYGKDSFKKELIAVFDSEEEAYKLEAELVNEGFVNSAGTYNGVVGGVGLTSEFVKEELRRRFLCPNYRAKHAKQMIKVNKRADVRKKRSDSMRLNFQNPEYKAKMAEAYKSDGRRKKLSDLAKRRHLENPDLARQTAEKRSRNPEWLKNVSEKNRRMAKDPAWLEKQRAALEKTKETPEWKEAHARGIAKRSKNPGWMASMKEAGKRRAADPNNKARMLEHNQRLKNDPKWLAAVRESKKDPEYLKALSDRVKAHWSDPEKKEIRLEAMRKKRENDPDMKRRHKEAASKANSKAVIANGVKYNRMQDAAAAMGITMYRLRNMIKSGDSNVMICA